MKKISFTLFALVCASILLHAQTPDSFNYQAVIRNNSGEILPETEIGFRIFIRDGSPYGYVIYKETHLVESNEFGIVNLQIGEGTPVYGSFENIDWRSGPKYFELQVDTEGGTNYISVGISQFLAVPFAMHAASSSSTNRISDTDGDTYVTAEQSLNDNTVRIYLLGDEKYRFTSRAIEQLNSGESLFIGEGAGLNENGSDNKNTFLGFKAGFQNVEGYENVAVGSFAYGNSPYGYRNIAIGSGSLYSNEGVGNVAMGWHSLYNNSLGSHNTATGNQSMQANTTGIGNAAFGDVALVENTTGSYNLAVGRGALYSNTSGYSNVAVGTDALYANTIRSNLVAIGDSALYNNGLNAIWGGEGEKNTAIGSKALYSNTTGSNNTAIGFEALGSNTTGFANIAIGHNVLTDNTEGYSNVAIGNFTMPYNDLGNGNIAVGNQTLSYIHDGDNNTAIGYFAGSPKYVDALYNTGSFGALSFCLEDNHIRLGNMDITSIGGYASWTTITDKKFINNIKTDVPGLEFILDLNPVTYQLNIEKLDDYLGTPKEYRSKPFFTRSAAKKSSIVQTGLVAQEVEQLAESLGFDFSGIDAPSREYGIYGVRYAEFVVPLIKAVQEQQLQIQQLEERIRDLERSRK